MPTFIVVSEYDNPALDTQGALLFGAFANRTAHATLHAYGGAQSPLDDLSIRFS